ncbi:putative Late nodulin [Lupinus albus]|uniref:Putative Late nodulin n=1 Tax=Lupinus albus TaxID=3870 RepID=A0A6A4QDV9_LUPAL|nr:putative Late nodulin [Lupinus albus]
MAKTHLELFYNMVLLFSLFILMIMEQIPCQIDADCPLFQVCRRYWCRFL